MQPDQRIKRVQVDCLVVQMIRTYERPEVIPQSKTTYCLLTKGMSEFKQTRCLQIKISECKQTWCLFRQGFQNLNRRYVCLDKGLRIKQTRCLQIKISEFKLDLLSVQTRFPECKQTCCLFRRGFQNLNRLVVYLDKVFRI